MPGLRRIFKSVLFSNIYNLFLLYGFSHIIPIVLMPFLLNTIGVEHYGLVNFSLAFAFYFQVVNEFGFDLSNVRHIVGNRDDKDKISEVASSIVCCKLQIFAVLAVIYTLAVLCVGSLREHWVLYMLAYVRILGICVSLNWLFRSMENLKYVTRISMIVKTLCVLPIFVLVRSQADYVWVMVFFTLQEVVGGVVSLLLAKRIYAIRLYPVRLSTSLYYLKDSIPFFTSTFLTRIYQTSNSVILGIFCGDYAVGVYTAAQKLHNAYASFVSPLLAHVFYPYFMRRKDFAVINRIVRFVIVGNIAMLFACYLLSPYVLPLFVKVETEHIVTYFNMFLLLLAVSVPADMFGYPYLGAMDMVDKVNRSAVYTSALYFVGAAVIMLAGGITVESVIWLLLATNLFCLLYRVRCICRVRTSMSRCL
ncbi:MAG: oligosaccharide flippase family protein [Alistipes sp.]|nr:oligosaccharide flippase family protein [Alistipes sp.]